MDIFELKGIWKGEYAYDDRFEPTIVKSAVPFILRIKSVNEHGLFEGMCQDDPGITEVKFAAEILGKINVEEIVFSKSYPKTTIRDKFGKISILDQPHPEVIYSAKVSDGERMLGTWSIERTFRRIDGRVMEIGPVTGIWWMNRY